MRGLYDPLRKIGWSEERIQKWLRTPIHSSTFMGLAPEQLDADTLSRAIDLVASVAPT